MSPPTRPKLLLIDDEAPSIALLLAYLKEQDMEILVALDGNDGLRKAFSNRPDLVLLDVRMPVLDGFATCRRLRADERTAATPVIFLSAGSDVKDKLEGFRAGGNDYIEKPFHKEEVLARITAWLNAARPIPMDASASVPQTSGDRLFDRAIGLIREHLEYPMSVEALAQDLGVNKDKLTSLFRARLGLTVFEYATEVRLDRSRQELAETEQRIQQIAMRAGYRNAGDFTRAFKRRFGMTPREYRLTCLDSVPDAP